MDPHREAARKAAYRAFDERVRGVPIADLVFDSLLDERRAWSRLAVVRAGVRRLRFETKDATIHVTAVFASDHVHLFVGLQPRFLAVIELRGHGKKPSSITTDDMGCAEFDAPFGLASFLVAPVDRPGGPRLQTAWVPL